MATVLTRKYLGIEIGAEAVGAGLVQLQRGADRVLAWNRQTVDGRRPLGDVLAAALEPILSRGDMTGAVVSVSLPAEEFFFRRLPSPFREARKLRQVLPYELEPGLPVAVDDLVFDFRRRKDEPGAPLLAAALERRRIEELLAELGSLRLDPERLTVGGLDAALQAARLPGAPRRFVALALADRRATLFLLDDGEVLDLRSVPLNAESAAGRRRIVDRLHRTCRAVPDADGRPFAPEALVLSGYTPSHDPLSEELAEAFDCPVSRADLAAALALDTGTEAVNGWNPGAMNGVLALALAGHERGMNLRQGPFAVKNFWSRNRLALQRTAALAVLVTVLAAGQTALSLHLKAERAGALQGRIEAVFRETFPDAARVVDPLNQMEARIRTLRETALLPGLDAEGPRAIDLLAFISRAIPQGMDVELTRLVMGPDTFTIAGHTAGFDTVDQIKNRLEEGPLLSAVTISAANIDKQSGRVRFNLTAAPGEAP